MPAKFVLIEPALKEIGSHYFEYASLILGEAEARGYQPILAVHQSFDDVHLLPENWQVERAFRFPDARIHRIPRGAYDLFDIAPTAPNVERTVKTMLAKGRIAFERSLSIARLFKRRRRIRSFIQNCSELFCDIDLQNDDHVFLATTGDLDLLALQRFLQSDPRTSQADWHIQFHYKIFAGREPDFLGQSKWVSGLGRRLQQMVDELPDHRLHFYNTTDGMARQYNQLQAAPFQELYYPVNPAFYNRRKQKKQIKPELSGIPNNTHSPLDVCVAGSVRKDKGFHLLSKVVDGLRREEIGANEVRLNVQTDGSEKSKAILALNKTTGEDLIQQVPHPLDGEKYFDFVLDTDIGLLLYDGQQFYARCSGVLAEMLCAATPVIVLAGSWLAEQLAEPIYRHLDDLIEESREHGVGYRVQLQLEETDGTPPKKLETVVETVVPADVGTAVVSFDAPCRGGEFVRLAGEQFDEEGRLLKTFTSILEPRRVDKTTYHKPPMRACFSLHDDACSLVLTWSNAYHRDKIAPINAMVDFLPEHCPAGAVGLIAASTDEVPELLRNMIDHHDHFKSTANEFSHEWSRVHNPQNTLRVLCGSQETPMAKAA